MFLKATFEAFIGIRDDVATSQVKLFGDYLQVYIVAISTDASISFFFNEVYVVLSDVGAQPSLR